MQVYKLCKANAYKTFQRFLDGEVLRDICVVVSYIDNKIIGNLSQTQISFFRISLLRTRFNFFSLIRWPFFDKYVTQISYKRCIICTQKYYKNNYYTYVFFWQNLLVTVQFRSSNIRFNKIIILRLNYTNIANKSNSTFPEPAGWNQGAYTSLLG